MSLLPFDILCAIALKIADDRTLIALALTNTGLRDLLKPELLQRRRNWGEYCVVASLMWGANVGARPLGGGSPRGCRHLDCSKASVFNVLHKSLDIHLPKSAEVLAVG